ncbi:unnamed protein product [Paramecium octaurelia]|uniref:Uncharacterized protein n=1 Tax=Paramecium octaurelia TaxID=43137 RepID=A0A8S1UH58_PAROT|nr:unnamed protein product [Paramecium octaurelia]
MWVMKNLCIYNQLLKILEFGEWNLKILGCLKEMQQRLIQIKRLQLNYAS